MDALHPKKNPIMLLPNIYEWIVGAFRTAFAIRKDAQPVSHNLLIIMVKINNFKFCCAPIDFIEEMSILSTILGKRTCMSAKIRPLVRKRPLEALTSKASRGYCFN